MDTTEPLGKTCARILANAYYGLPARAGYRKTLLHFRLYLTECYKLGYLGASNSLTKKGLEALRSYTSTEKSS